MKKVILASMLAFFSVSAFAANRVLINNTLPACAGQVTVQFYAYTEGTCAFDISTNIFPAANGKIYDLDNSNTWLPGTLSMPSYETFSAEVSILCPGMSAPFVLPQVGLDMTPGRACSQIATPSFPIPSPCQPTIGADVVNGSVGGGVCFTLNIHS